MHAILKLNMSFSHHCELKLCVLVRLWKFSVKKSGYVLGVSNSSFFECSLLYVVQGGLFFMKTRLKDYTF
jgi:hypothetical protein